jgi:threonine aldolase
MIDLRSDTVTRPPPAMGQAMMAAADIHRALDGIARRIAAPCVAS